jgi:hypothetical protein
MEGTAVHLAVRLTPRDIAAICAALVHVQHNAAGLSEIARAELAPRDAWLTDAEVDGLLSVLGSAEDVLVLTPSHTPVTVTEQSTQLLREAFELLNDADSRLDRRDWTREAKKLLRDPILDPRD